MAINLFSDYGGFYNNYKLNSIPKVDVSEVKKQDELLKQAKEAVPQIPVVEEISSAPVVDNRSRMADLDNISLNFNQGDDFSYIGSDFAIEGLDIEQAISDMRKDKILEDYQYFVGNSSVAKPVFGGSEDGTVFIK